MINLNEKFDEWIFMCIDQIKQLADFLGVVQTPTQNTCTAYRTLTSVKLQKDGTRVVALWYRYLLGTDARTNIPAGQIHGHTDGHTDRRWTRFIDNMQIDGPTDLLLENYSINRETELIVDFLFGNLQPVYIENGRSSVYQVYSLLRI